VLIRALLAVAIVESTPLPDTARWIPIAGPPPVGVAATAASAEPPRFRYDEASGRCLDTEGREGYNPGVLEALRRGNGLECGDFRGRRYNLTYLRVSRANLRGANFEGALFYLGSITDSDLSGADLSGTSGQMDYTGSRLRRARLSGADLSWSDLRGSDLDGADLRGARFSPHTQLPFDHDEALRRGMVLVPMQ